MRLQACSKDSRISFEVRENHRFSKNKFAISNLFCPKALVSNYFQYHINDANFPSSHPSSCPKSPPLWKKCEKNMNFGNSKIQDFEIRKMKFDWRSWNSVWSFYKGIPQLSLKGNGKVGLRVVLLFLRFFIFVIFAIDLKRENQICAKS